MWWFLTFTTKQNKENTHPQPRPAPDIFPGTGCSRAAGTPCSCCESQTWGSAPSKVRPRGELAGPPCPAGSTRSGSRILARGVCPLLGRNPENAEKQLAGLPEAGGDQTRTFSDDFCTKSPHTKDCSPGKRKPREWEGASGSFSRPPSSRPLLKYCWRRRLLKACSLFQRSCLCVCGSSFLGCKPSTPSPSGSSQLDCRHLVARSGGHISPCPPSLLLSWVPSLFFFVSPTSYQLDFYNPALWV